MQNGDNALNRALISGTVAGLGVARDDLHNLQEGEFQSLRLSSWRFLLGLGYFIARTANRARRDGWDRHAAQP
jgi:hypothetical protein